MTESMIDRVAKAMAARRAIYAGVEVDQIVINEDNERVPYWTLYAEEARAAIEAMREPAGRMVPDGWLAAHRVQTKDRCNHEMLRRAWVAMIDSTLEGAP